MTDDAASVIVQGFDGSLIRRTEGEKKQRRLHINGTAEIVRMAKARVSQPGFFQDAPRGVAFTNAFARASQGRMVLERIKPSHRIRWGYDFDFVEDATERTKLPLVYGYFERVFRSYAPAVRTELGTLLMEHAGVCILGQSSRLAKALILFDRDQGGSGKSQWLSIVEAMFPLGTVVSVPPHQLGGSDRSEYYRALCVSGLINIVNEMPDSDVVGSEAFKAIIDGKPVSYRHPGGRAASTVMLLGMLFACNGLPGTQDQSKAFYDRWIAIHFPERIRGTADDVKEYWKVLRDAELPQLVSRALELAAVCLHRGCYTVPDVCNQVVTDWRQESDVVALWKRQRTRDAESEPPTSWAPLDELWEAFKAWSEGARMGKSMGKRLFTRRLDALAPRKHFDWGNRYPLLVLEADRDGEQDKEGEPKAPSPADDAVDALHEMMGWN